MIPVQITFPPPLSWEFVIKIKVFCQNKDVREHLPLCPEGHFHCIDGHDTLTCQLEN